MHIPILDGQISRALIQPTPWEVQQWRRAALRDKAEWSKLIDTGSSHRFCDDVLRSVDNEIRRERIRCGPAPCISAAAPVPTELTRREYYNAVSLFSWLRADSRVEVSSKVTSFTDKVLLPAQGGLANNARSIDANHAFSQATSGNQVPAVATSATWNNQLVASFSAAQFYDSTLTASSWIFMHDGSGSGALHVYRTSTTGVDQVIHSTTNVSTANGSIFNAVASGSIIFQVVKTSGFILNRTIAAANTSATFALCTLRTASTPDYSAYIKTTLADSADVTATPTALAPPGTMRIGGQAVNGVVKFSGELADCMFFNKEPSSAERAGAARYILLRYNVS